MFFDRLLDKNPLENIRNTEMIRYTMLTGRLYEAEMMNETNNTSRVRSGFYWEPGRNVESFPVITKPLRAACVESIE